MGWPLAPILGEIKPRLSKPAQTALDSVNGCHGESVQLRWSAGSLVSDPSCNNSSLCE